MSQWNSLPGFNEATTKELLEAQGVAQFQTDQSFFQVMNGLVVQGGITPLLTAGVDTVVPFPAGFPTQLLTVILQPVGATAANCFLQASGTNKDQMSVRTLTANSRFYYLAVGV